MINQCQLFIQSVQKREFYWLNASFFPTILLGLLKSTLLHKLRLHTLHRAQAWRLGGKLRAKLINRYSLMFIRGLLKLLLVTFKRRLKAQSYNHSICKTAHTHRLGVNYYLYLHENSAEAFASWWYMKHFSMSILSSNRKNLRTF